MTWPPRAATTVFPSSRARHNSSRTRSRVLPASCAGSEAMKSAMEASAPTGRPNSSANTFDGRPDSG
ncbi:MAG: hypothetical protein ACKO9Z_17510 [Planctomycetota bacterium]